MNVVADGILRCRLHFNFIARRQEGVEPGDEKRVAFEQLRYSIDYPGGIDTAG